MQVRHAPGMFGVGRFWLRWLGWRERGFWFQTWRPAWYAGRIRYITIGFGFFAFYAGDPPAPF